LRFVLVGYVLSALGMAVLPASASLSLRLLIAAIVFLPSGINVQKSPFQERVACVAAIVFLMLGWMLGRGMAFLIAAWTVLVIAVAFAFGTPAVSLMLDFIKRTQSARADVQ
jgi:hypothetical protein